MKLTGFGTLRQSSDIITCDYGNPKYCGRCKYRKACEEYSKPLDNHIDAIPLDDHIDAILPIKASKSLYRLKQFILLLGSDSITLRMIYSIIRLNDQGIKVNTQSLADETGLSRETISKNIRKVKQKHPELEMFMKLVEVKRIKPPGKVLLGIHKSMRCSD